MFATTNQVIQVIAYILFGLGILCLILSIIILAKQTVGKNIQTIANQTTKLAEKGITDGVSGLVGNASLLISSLNDLSRSNSGIGIFFVFLSLVLLAAAYFFIKSFIGVIP
ncbi:MAG TPA: hypothetical protein PLV20_00880 [Anaerolineaceae bacterium]|jgi:Na+-transporting methylmalonyl-CoA/oxaloacetate decarboxylase gamma subunit|nr:hypothetical protein [Anaerolineales bacterium]HOG57906.1 hypothetical protein [Anaerolineaceae bacterium]HOR83753.1 hypothetical protein [Anaerolineaceae bacterium]HPL42723.1 hypothetical protein [Anaerolineaceae bacterium]HPY33436.1 hypothetical protein [Anaerolineaceae bacterium]